MYIFKFIKWKIMKNFIKNKNKEKRKKYIFLSTLIGGCFVFINYYKSIGLIIISSSIYFGYKWIIYKIKNGLRF
jgi:hypothetical protein